MAWTERERDPDSYSKVLSAFDGVGYAMDDGSSKVLRLLLEHPEGCDATLSPERFEVRFGWHYARHRYLLRFAPAAVGRILELVGCPPGTTNVRGLLVSVDGGQWACGKRRVWLHASANVVTIQVRDGEGDRALADVPSPLPELMPAAPRFVKFASLVACPHCGVRADSFRHLYEGPLVCASCGGSFEWPA